MSVPLPEISDKNVADFQHTVRENSDYSFNDYSINSLKRRLTKVMEEYGPDFDKLLRTISTDQLAMEEVVKKITVNTTELFRDPKIWTRLYRNLLPRFSKHSSLNVWHPGCSTGQEVYSMMILLDQAGLLDRTDIYASDLNTDVLKTAKNGSYRLRFNREYIDNYKTIFGPDEEGNGNSEFKPYTEYFKTDEARDVIQMNDMLRKKPIYKKIDLVKDDNLFFVNFDIIICRNVIIYFNYELQNKVLKLFHRTLRRNGALVLGLHESIIGQGTALFQKEEYFYIKRSK